MLIMALDSLKELNMFQKNQPAHYMFFKYVKESHLKLSFLSFVYMNSKGLSFLSQMVVPVCEELAVLYLDKYIPQFVSSISNKILKCFSLQLVILLLCF